MGQRKIYIYKKESKAIASDNQSAVAFLGNQLPRLHLFCVLFLSLFPCLSLSISVSLFCFSSI